MSKPDVFDDYTDPEKPGAFSGNAQGQDLSGVDAYTLHRKVVRRFPRAQHYAHHRNHVWHVDLADVSNIKNKSYGQWFNYWLCAVDVFSKYAYVRALRNKEASTTARAMQDIFEEAKTTPKVVFSDRGTEFYGAYRDLLSKHNIRQIWNQSRLRSKAAIVERFIRTLKERLYRYFTHTRKTNYAHVLQQLVASYNNTYHTSIKMRPSEVTDKNEECVRQNQYGDREHDVLDFKFKIGDYVRIPRVKGVFEKGYTEKWERTIYVVTRRIPAIPPKYAIRRTDTGEERDEYFYEQELQHVQPNEYPYDTFEVLDEEDDKILVRKLNSENASEPEWVAKKHAKDAEPAAQAAQEATKEEAAAVVPEPTQPRYNLRERKKFQYSK